MIIYPIEDVVTKLHLQIRILQKDVPLSPRQLSTIGTPNPTQPIHINTTTLPTQSPFVKK
jgi:hypothetical protein